MPPWLPRCAYPSGTGAVADHDGGDGTGRGPNIEDTVALAQTSGIPVLASGGVGSVADIAALAAVAEAGIEGVVVGRALYTGGVSLSDAMRAVRGRSVAAGVPWVWA